MTAAPTDEAAGRFYVSARDGRKIALLAGPFPTHRQALDQIDAAKPLAIDLDPRMAFAAFGTCRWKADTPAPPGKLNRLLGLEEPS